MNRVARLSMMLSLLVLSLVVTAQSVAAQSAQTAPRTGNTFTCSTGNCVPEAPVAIILPFVAVVALGIVWLVMARSRRADRVTDAQ